MISRKHPRTSFSTLFNFVFSLSLLGITYVVRGPIFTWAKEPWQILVIWFFIGILSVNVIRLFFSFVTERITTFYSLWFKKKSKPTEQLRIATTSTDRPIRRIKDDQLGFIKYAFVLAHHIAHAETPLTIGIHGDWGAGKTSLANLIRCFLQPRTAEWDNDTILLEITKKLNENGRDIGELLPNDLLKSIEIIDLNAWQYSSANSLWRALILRLSKRAEERGYDATANDWHQRLYYSISRESKGEIRLNTLSLFTSALKAATIYLGNLLLPTTWLVFCLQALGIVQKDQVSLIGLEDLFEQQKYSVMRKQMESIEEFQTAFRELVDLLLNRQFEVPDEKRRVVFIIDDLDRCLPEVALEIMETIKTFLDVPRCVYILLCDQRLLGQGVKLKFRDLGDEREIDFKRRGKEYIEKIIQVSFQIPPLDQQKVKGFAQIALQDLYMEKEIPYFDIVYATVADNPRKIKRLCRGMEIAFDMMQLTVGEQLSTVSSGSGETNSKNQESAELPDRDSGNSERFLVNRVKLKMNEAKREFAKVFCLQYAWPNAITYVQAYLEGANSNQSLDTFIPEHIAVRTESPSSKKIIDREIEYLTIVRNRLERIERDFPDLQIFAELLLVVDWEKAATIGEEALEIKHPELWHLLKTPPFFSQMYLHNLKNYIEWSAVIVGEEAVDKPKPPEIFDTRIENLDLSVRLFNILRSAGITTVGELLDLLEKGEDAIMSIRDFDEKSLDKLIEKLHEAGYLEEVEADQDTIASSYTSSKSQTNKGRDFQS